MELHANAAIEKPDGMPAWLPGLVVSVLAILLSGSILITSGQDASYFLRIGTYYSLGDPQGSKGYDGQFVYYIASDPDPQSVASKLDAPAYRYQRILLPLLVRWFSFGNPALMPWVLWVIGVLSIGAGTWAVAVFLKEHKTSSWYALVYGLYPGVLLSLIVALPEPLAYALVAWGIVWMQKGKRLLGWTCLLLAGFTKEVMLIFSAAAILDYFIRKEYRLSLALACLSGLPFLIFQGWLYLQFGEFGIGSGGDMATSFEWLPFMGLMRIAEYSQIYFAAMLVVFGPFTLLPALWGFFSAIRTWLQGEKNVIVLALIINTLTIMTMPFSTFRETGGLLRFTIGLILTILFYAARYNKKRVLNYSVFWLVLNVFLLNGW